ncbi:MAG: hypothetical protein SNJ56_03430 [Termitinemataceae bacterium]
MFDPKISGIIAGIASLLSFLFGLVFGVSFWVVVVRALLFGLLFFVLSGLAYWLITQYIPELIQYSSESGDDQGVPDLGSRVNITLEDEADTVPQGSLAAQLMKEGLEEDQDEIHDEIISSKALDQNEEAGYTESEIITARMENVQEASPSPALPTGVIDSVDELPDLEGLSDAFVVPVTSVLEETSNDTSVSSPSPRSRTGQTGQSGDFDPKEMAMAIQTLLKRDQKG